MPRVAEVVRPDTAWFLYIFPEMIEPIFHATLAVFLMMMLGSVLRFFRWLPHEADPALEKLSVNLLYPCLIFSKIFDSNLRDDFATMWLLPTCGFVLTIAGLICGWLFARLPAALTGLHDARQRRTFAASVSMFNYAFLPIPLIMQIYPQQMQGQFLTMLFVFNLGVELALWLCVVPQMAGGLEPGWWKKLFRIPLLAILAAITMNLSGIHYFVPAGVKQALHLLGMAQIPISLLMIGAIIFDELTQKIHVTRKRDTTKIIVGTFLIRSVLLPAAMIYVAWRLPAYPVLQQIIVIQAAMPCAMMTIMFSRMYHGAPSVATRSVLSSSITSLATVVFWITLGMWVISSPLVAGQKPLTATTFRMDDTNTLYPKFPMLKPFFSATHTSGNATSSNTSDARSATYMAILISTGSKTHCCTKRSDAGNKRTCARIIVPFCRCRHSTGGSSRRLGLSSEYKACSISDWHKTGQH